MKKVLVTGGTVFVSRYLAEYYIAKGYEVYVMNRNHREQSEGVRLVKADRYNIGNALGGMHFDLVIDTAYTGQEVRLLLDALDSYTDYVLISSSAVYPEYGQQPFREDSVLARNRFWGNYGTEKIEAEKVLLERNPDAYILRPAYLYGPMNDIYREAFVFDCALAGRKFYLPRDGKMKLQFFHVQDLCRLMDAVLNSRPARHIFKAGNKDTISFRDWSELCYKIAGKQAEFVEVFEETDQRNYFCFDNYEYCMDVSEQDKLLADTKRMDEGLRESFEWYQKNESQVEKMPYLDFIDRNMRGLQGIRKE